MGTTAEKLAYLNNTKTAIKDAIVESGIDIPDSTPFVEYANKTKEILKQFEPKIDAIIGSETASEITDMTANIDALYTIVVGTDTGVEPNLPDTVTLASWAQEAIIYAIQEKGVDIPDNTSFWSMDSYISDIVTGMEKLNWASASGAHMPGSGSIKENKCQLTIGIYDHPSQSICVFIPLNGNVYTFTLVPTNGEYHLFSSNNQFANTEIGEIVITRISVVNDPGLLYVTIESDRSLEEITHNCSVAFFDLPTTTISNE